MPVLGRQQIQLLPGRGAAACRAVLHRSRQEPGPDDDGVRASGVLDLTNGRIGPGLPHRLLVGRRAARQIAVRRGRRVDRRVEHGVPGERPQILDAVRVVEVAEQRRHRVRVGRDGRGHVVERRVEGLVERAAHAFPERDHRAPDAADLDVGHLGRRVDEVGVAVDALAVAQRAQLRQQVERDERPDLDARARIDGVHHAVVGANEDERAAILVIGRKARVVGIGRRIQRGRIHECRRRADHRAERLGPHVVDQASGVPRVQVRAERGRVRVGERHDRPIGQHGEDVPATGRRVVAVPGHRRLRHPQRGAVADELVAGRLGRVGCGLVEAIRPHFHVETRQREARRDHDVGALRHLGAALGARDVGVGQRRAVERLWRSTG